MRSRTLVFILAFLLGASGRNTAQQTTSSAAVQPQASTLLAQSAVAQVASTSITDVSISGSCRSIVGTDDESCTAVLKATANGESRLDLNLPGGNFSEIRSIDPSGNLIGAWASQDGVQHAISYHNLLTDPSWFVPALTLTRILGAARTQATYLGNDTLNGLPVLHVVVVQAPNDPIGQAAPAGTIRQHLSQMDFYLDSATLLPVALFFTTHPDSNALLDIPVQIQFSNYQKVGGVQVPFHIQRFINGSLSLDLQVQSVTFNSGLSASTFSIQVTQ